MILPSSYEEKFLKEWIEKHISTLNGKSWAGVLYRFMQDAMKDPEFTEFDRDSIFTAISEELLTKDMVMVEGVWIKNKNVSEITD